MAGRRVAPTPPGSVLSLHSSDNASDAQHSDSSVSSHSSDDPRVAMQRALAVSHGSRRAGTGTPGGDREVARDSEMADIMREFDAQPVASVPEAPPRQARYPLYWLRRTLGCFACDVDLRDAVMDGYVEEVEDALKRAAATGEEAGHWVDLRQDASGYPALHLAIQMSRQDLSDMLIKNDYVNADPSRVDAQLRQSPLHHAVQASLVRAVGRLCKKGAFVDARDHAGMTVRWRSVAVSGAFWRPSPPPTAPALSPLPSLPAPPPAAAPGGRVRRAGDLQGARAARRQP